MLEILMAGVLYLDIGASVHDMGDDLTIKNQPWLNTIGTVEAGYSIQARGTTFTLYASHKSSVQMEDKGLNEIGIKTRLLEW